MITEEFLWKPVCKEKGKSKTREGQDNYGLINSIVQNKCSARPNNLSQRPTSRRQWSAKKMKVRSDEMLQESEFFWLSCCTFKIFEIVLEPIWKYVQNIAVPQFQLQFNYTTLPTVAQLREKRIIL